MLEARYHVALPIIHPDTREHSMNMMELNSTILNRYLANNLERRPTIWNGPFHPSHCSV